MNRFLRGMGVCPGLPAGALQAEVYDEGIILLLYAEDPVFRSCD